MISRERLAGMLLLAACVAWTPSTGADESGTAAAFSPPEHLAQGWYVRIETPEGRVLVRLLTEQAPQSVAHFAALAEGRLEWTDPATGETIKERYFDGSQVFRAVAGNRFEVGRRQRGAGPKPAIYVPEERGAAVRFAGGMRMGLTRVGPRISPAEFFVTASPQQRLDGRFNCIGEVVEGEDVIVRIAQAETHPGGRLVDPLSLATVDVFAVGEPPALPEPKPFELTPERMQKIEGEGGR